MIRTIALTALALTGAGCASIPQQAPTEAVWQTLNAVDFGQTLRLTTTDGLHENNPLLGRHPSEAKVAAYFVASAATHYAITRALEDKPRWVQLVWGSVTIGATGYCVGANITLFRGK